MKLCYIVYREDNVMVFQSQVLEYLREMKKKCFFDSIELIVFRHEQNLTKKTEEEKQIRNYVDKTMTFWSFPVLSIAQLNVNVGRLRKYLSSNYYINEQIVVICRGDLAAYIGVRAFAKYNSSRILYDNRGLAFEESIMSHSNNIIHKINRQVKRTALNRSKSHCDMYNFVTNNMREYLISQYGYNPKLPYTIIPTLYHTEEVDKEKLKKIMLQEKIQPTDFVISYVGSTAAWQSTKQLVDLIQKIGERYNNIKFFILSNGTIPELENLSGNIRERIIMKSVPHSEMRYYLYLTQIGIVIRNKNIVNYVAAPTKIAEYLTNGITILYSGDIGIISDLEKTSGSKQMICIDTDQEWLEKINPEKYSPKKADPAIVSYFDMNERQKQTLEMIKNAFAFAKNI